MTFLLWYLLRQRDLLFLELTLLMTCLGLVAVEVTRIKSFLRPEIKRSKIELLSKISHWTIKPWLNSRWKCFPKLLLLSLLTWMFYRFYKIIVILSSKSVSHLFFYILRGTPTFIYFRVFLQIFRLIFQSSFYHGWDILNLYFRFSFKRRQYIVVANKTLIIFQLTNQATLIRLLLKCLVKVWLILLQNLCFHCFKSFCISTKTSICCCWRHDFGT